MRYGNPSVGSAIELLREEGCDRILVLPLFPQYASSSTGSAVEKPTEKHQGMEYTSSTIAGALLR